MDDNTLLTQLEESIDARDIEAVSKTLPALKQEAISSAAVFKALSRGIERAREKFKQGIYSIPDFLLAIDAYRKGLSFINKVDARNDNETDAQIIIGVVKGDVHDMGKNIVAAVLEASGYRVMDMGRDVANDVFLDALNRTNAQVLALSTMMSTTLENMGQLIAQARRLRPDISILVGGAPFDADLARRMGADGYAESAIAIPAEARRVISGSPMTKLPSQSPS